MTDFTALSSTFLLFTPTMRTICTNISITNDANEESTEQFRLTIVFPGSSQPTNLILRPDNANVTILDDDGMYKSDVRGGKYADLIPQLPQI